MAKDFGNAKMWAHELLEEAVCDGGTVIDATMGNGHDTLFLCSLVGESGKVYAFDIQKEALESTSKRLIENNMNERAVLFQKSHEFMDECVDEKADAIVFNLGWLPHGNKEITTLTQSTLKAVDKALELLKPTGLLTVCIYPGHDEGTREKHALISWASELDEKRYDVFIKSYLNQTNSPPLLLAIRKRP